MKQFVFRWAATTIAVMVASSIIRGIHYDTVAALIGASLLLGILNAFVRPFLLILSAPVILLTLGLFILVLNGFLLLLVPSVVAGFHVQLLERILGCDRDQLRQLGFERIFPRERWTRACVDPSHRDTSRPRSSP